MTNINECNYGLEGSSGLESTEQKLAQVDAEISAVSRELAKLEVLTSRAGTCILVHVFGKQVPKFLWVHK